MNEVKKGYIVKKEKLILSYLLIIASIFGIVFYTFIIVDGISLLFSIFIFILGASLIILLFKGKLTSLKKSRDKNMYLITSILQYILSMGSFLLFIVNPSENALFLILGLLWPVVGVYSTLLYVKIRETQPWIVK